MIDERNFPATIKRMKNELAALKIAHERGLGLIEYLKYKSSFTAPEECSYVTITATALEGEVTPFFALLSTNDYTYNYLYWATKVTDNSISWQMYAGDYDFSTSPASWAARNFVVEIISTAAVNITWVYGNDRL